MMILRWGPVTGCRSPGSGYKVATDACRYALARFLVEVPQNTIEAFVTFEFSSDQQDDLVASSVR